MCCASEGSTRCWESERLASSRRSSPRRAAGWQQFRLLECLELWTWAFCSGGLACKCNKEYSVVGVWLSVLWLLSFTALLVEEVGCQCWATVDVDVLWTLVWSNLFGTSGFRNPWGRKKCVWTCGGDKVLSKQQRRFKVFTTRQLLLSICTCLVGWEILASNSVIFTFKKNSFSCNELPGCLSPGALSVFGVWIGDVGKIKFNLTK